MPRLWRWASSASTGRCGSSVTYYRRRDRGEVGALHQIPRFLSLGLCRGVTLDFSGPGKPKENAYIDAFKDRHRAERFNAHWFLTLADVHEKGNIWFVYCNEVCPHSAIRDKSLTCLIPKSGACRPGSRSTGGSPLHRPRFRGQNFLGTYQVVWSKIESNAKRNSELFEP